MESTYLVRLAFGTAGPAVEGKWSVPGTAQARYTERVGLHGANPAAVIQLIENRGGHRQVRRTWTVQAEFTGSGLPALGAGAR
ncbi:hypothetical protein [Streptomyces sp. TLI_146]|uniref:hypothetical protein n=1 Tax=Streptomyces sp. TLI_146 TaxID=1938858 RepID=UPI000C6FD9A2|nr:hypothetical protein [Streptomyces sp. TLI_146]PKV84210.1 hypothetical protein BX283_1721 [Streptomyces sp. TLI_146]